MPTVPPKVYLRLGSHAEKDYFEKLGKFGDGVIFGANLVESTPGATASLIVKLTDDKMLGSYLLDPMTYAFGEYFDYEMFTVRNDLGWIKSEQKKGGKTVTDFKKSYKGLAAKYGGAFQEALDNGVAITAATLGTAARQDECAKGVVRYQMERLREEFSKDEEFQKFADKVPLPAAVFAPYFYIEPKNAADLLSLNMALARSASDLDVKPPVHAIICADASFLSDAALVTRLVVELPATGVKGVWLWFSKFYEEKGDESQLQILVSLIRSLADAGLDVYNMHGGFFSLCLSKIGLAGVSHGVGYGEQKDVVPIIGQSTPTVRYYLPDVHVRLGVAEIERCFKGLGVHSANDFFAKICDCAICKGVLSGNLEEFKQFGEMRFSTPESKRLAQSPAAAKRCRFHFLLNRFRERDTVAGLSLPDLQGLIAGAWNKWGQFPTVQDSARHLPRWQSILGKIALP